MFRRRFAWPLSAGVCLTFLIVYCGYLDALDFLITLAACSLACVALPFALLYLVVIREPEISNSSAPWKAYRRWASRYGTVSDFARGERLVTAKFCVSECEYGNDVGLLHVVDDWLLFEGERTTFCVSPADLRRTDCFFGPTIALVLAEPSTARVSIEIEQISHGRLEDLRTWFYMKEVPTGVSVLPPLEPEPLGNWSRWRSPYPLLFLSITGALLGSIVAQGAFVSASWIGWTAGWLGAGLAASGVIAFVYVRQSRAFRSLAAARARICASMEQNEDSSFETPPMNQCRIASN